MKATRLIIAALAGLLCLAGCKDRDGLVSFSFGVLSGNIEEGQDLPVSVIIREGPREGYSLESRVERYDVTAGTGEPVDAVLYSGDIPAGSLSGVSFPDGGKKDFRVPGLTAGTYKVSVTLSLDGIGETASTVAVVSPKEGTVDPPGPEPVKVTSFTLPGSRTGFDVENVSGMEYVLVDIDTYHSGNPLSYKVVFTPGNADDKSVTASSDNGNVITASVKGSDTIVLVPVSEGTATIVVRSGDGNASGSFSVKVYRKSGDNPGPGGDDVSDFTLPELDAAYGKLPIGFGTTYTFTPQTTPAGKKPAYQVSSSDADVVSVSAEDGVISVKALKPGYASVSVGVPDGPSKSFPVLVYRNVAVTVEWNEPEPSEAQLRTKTFPCYLRISSDMAVTDSPFPDPVTFAVSSKAVVNVSGHDAQSVTHKTDLRFYGNRPVSYDLTQNLLLSAYQVAAGFGSPNDFGLAVTVSLQRSGALDPDIWRVTWNETYKTQEARIKEYLKDIQQ